MSWRGFITSVQDDQEEEDIMEVSVLKGCTCFDIH